MSRAFPQTARKYDAYLATSEPRTLGRVFFVGDHRFVIREQYTREAWEQQRRIPPANNGPDRLLGHITVEDRPGPIPSPDRAAQPSDDIEFFYGADLI